MSTAVADQAAPRRAAARPALLIPLDRADDARLVGGKAHTLARLISLGIPVPDGFVLTCDAFEAFLRASSMGPLPTLRRSRRRPAKSDPG
jgi:pyruvate,water dikinase